MRKIEKDVYAKWYIDKNIFSASFNNWIVEIKPIFVGNGLLLRWTLNFFTSGKEKSSDTIYCDDIEDAISLIDKYKDIIQFDDLIKSLIKDNNQPSDYSYSNNSL